VGTPWTIEELTKNPTIYSLSATIDSPTADTSPA
jgi:hypothetical protein